MGRSYPNEQARTTPPRRAAVRVAATAISALAALPAARAGDAPPVPLMGDAAWSRIVGNTVSGSTPDGPYVEFFAPDGTLRIADGDGSAGGRWSLRDAKLCTTVDDEDEECRALAVDGAAGAFLDDAGHRYAFDILPGNPKGL